MDDCVKLMDKISNFLKSELNLELSEKKTRITNASKDYAEFLSVRIKRGSHETYSIRGKTLSRNIKGLRLLAPIDKITKKLVSNGFLKENRPYPKFV